MSLYNRALARGLALAGNVTDLATAGGPWVTTGLKGLLEQIVGFLFGFRESIGREVKHQGVLQL